MYVLHYAPDNASLIVRLLLEEAGLPHRTALVDRATRAQDSAAYRALNPAGLIPVLETPDGPLAETGAILLWLADRHGLAPAVRDAGRAPFLHWLFFLSNTVHAEMRRMFYPDVYAPEGAAAAHHAGTTALLHRHFTLLDAAAARQPALFAPPMPTALYAATLARWAALYPRGQTGWFAPGHYPQLARLAAAMDARPATRRAALAEGLGEAPFTAPAIPRP